jgi:nicotinamide-nucleotide amidase
LAVLASGEQEAVTDGVGQSAEQLVSDIAAAATDGDLRVAVAESVTAGNIASALATGADASVWFRGGVVAYSAHAKHGLLGVPEGPLITPECAEAMARGVARHLEADVALATTGVGGPDAVEGHPAGTVWYGVVAGPDGDAHCEHFAGDPSEVVHAAARHALELLRDRVRSAAARRAHAAGGAG